MYDLLHQGRTTTQRILPIHYIIAWKLWNIADFMKFNDGSNQKSMSSMKGVIYDVWNMKNENPDRSEIIRTFSDRSKYFGS